MYDFVDQPVERLCNGGRFLLWAMRGWSLAIAQGTCPPVALSRGFAGVGALPALHDFHVAMALLNRDAPDKLNLAPMDCAHIAEDEAVLAGLWRDVALGRTETLRATLELMIGEDGIGPVMRAMATAMTRLTAEGLGWTRSVPEPQKETK
jgi:hypothetical protein